MNNLKQELEMKRNFLSFLKRKEKELEVSSKTNENHLMGLAIVVCSIDKTEKTIKELEKTR